MRTLRVCKLKQHFKLNMLINCGRWRGGGLHIRVVAAVPAAKLNYDLYSFGALNTQLLQLLTDP